MPSYQRKIVYLSQAQYEELVDEGSITVSGTTITFSQNDVYVTPFAEQIASIDDTAGTGDTDVTWSADKIAGIIGDVETLLSGI